MLNPDNFLQVKIENATELRNWLQNNHTQQESIWLVTYKKEVADKYVSVQEILDELLCFGWIDGVRKKLDEQTTMQLISPRKAQHWTKTYKDRFTKLEKEGKMMDAGRQSVALSKQNGMWNYMDDVDALIKPDDFIKCLQEHGNAMNNFNAFGKASQRNMLRQIKIAKTAATRAKRILEISVLAKDNIKLPGS
jgi:uncharacterized protein YdeI (YjbR/CyaY-like superfamily)